jgi:hypothetical protein
MRAAGAGLSGAFALLAIGASAGALAAQAQLPHDAIWTLEGNRGGYCIWYLADPDLARRMVPSSTVLTPAGSGTGLPILLASTIKEEPRFAQWIPGAICLGFYERVSAEGHTLAEGKRDRPIIIATSALAAQNARGVVGATEYLLDLMTDNRSLANAADRIGVDMTGIEYLSRLRVEGGDPAITINVAGTVISWSGHALSDSSVGKTRSVSFGYGGPRSANWALRLDAAPGTARGIVGNLSIDGRSLLAKALLASPVRAIGPEESGGSAILTFHAVTRP